jgi:hypothetical protein
MELILRILHGIKTDIGGILSWIRKELKRDILLKTMETKVAIEGKSLSEEDFKKLEETQKQVEEIKKKKKIWFRIEGPYILDCNELRQFPYIEQFRTWRAQKCCKFPEIPSYMDVIRM